MDAAYDHIQEEVLRTEETTKQTSGEPETKGNLNAELQEAFKSFSASPWGARLGGFLGSVRKQGESYYHDARQEATAVGEDALKGFTDLKSTLVSRARSLSTAESSVPSTVGSTGENALGHEDIERKKKERTESESLRESEGLISRFRSEAAKRLKDIEKAEDAADEALLKFGTNIRNFLRDAVSIAPPTDEKDGDGKSKVLFESKDQEGKRVIHSTRFDAQLHAIHSSVENFTKDPNSPEYENWASTNFDVEQKTTEIASDLEKYEELRRAMERLVPEKVEYVQFWRRYYFLRMVIETEEQRRRDLLKGAALAPLEEVGWDEDSDSEPSTPQPGKTVPDLPLGLAPKTSTSTPTASTTISAPQARAMASEEPSKPDESDALKPNEPRRSQDQHSQPDSDASYDLVSGVTTGAPGSPKDEKEKAEGAVTEERAESTKDNKFTSETGKEGGKAVESDEEDWE